MREIKGMGMTDEEVKAFVDCCKWESRIGCGF